MLKKKKLKVTLMLVVALAIMIIPSKQIKAENTSFSLAWNGSSSPSSAASVSKDNYNSSKRLAAGFTMTGDAFVGTAYMSGVPTNYSLRSGGSSARYPVGYSNLGTYLILDLTPSASYNGKTVKCTVSLLGVNGCNLYSNGNYDYA
ncbi:MAG: hypothetical protein MR992_07650 [Lachnospiraceae bacterium]|nr:hypothetical protein [Lachnospiraceae bacterium]MDD7452963.1 hypothetical protein [Blautia obeum]MDD7628905.1 hypothetical protein [Lachnospiraceae bacterium]MDY4120400.1 hypothetical protein [Lachnospiraceae bacterium]